ncbi:MAG: RagB/SusD family nutrient uptake outer membrane protein [Cyclobacteriaceae bacterium]
MEKILKYQTQALLVILAVAFSSCNEFLDEVPDNRVALDDIDKAAQLLTTGYSIASPAFTDWMTDNVSFTRGVTIRMSHDQAYKWEEFFDDPNEQDTPAFYWYQTYNAIAHANEVLTIIDELDAVSEEDQSKKRALESEALLIRAYGHFMLVNLFAKHYNEQTAGSDLGVPYVDTPETVFIETYSRNTVREVYDRVEEDMLRGIELLDDRFFANSGKYHFNRNAALAFASRFYLFKREYAECVNFSSQMLGATPSNFVRELGSEEFQLASSSVTAYPQLYSSPDQPSNLMMMRKISLVQITGLAHGPTTQLANDLFGETPFTISTDFRENPAFIKGENGVFPARYESLFERSGLNSSVGFPYHIAMIFRGEEVLLNRAEAYVELNQFDNALQDLQVLVEKRYSGDPVISLELIRNWRGVGNSPFVRDSNLLRDFVLLERRKEFIIQGMRWFDIKRHSIEVEHLLQDEETTITLREDDRRKVLQIPTSAIEIGGLQPNPR